MRTVIRFKQTLAHYVKFEMIVFTPRFYENKTGQAEGGYTGLSA